MDKDQRIRDLERVLRDILALGRDDNAKCRVRRMAEMAERATPTASASPATSAIERAKSDPASLIYSVGQVIAQEKEGGEVIALATNGSFYSLRSKESIETYRKA